MNSVSGAICQTASMVPSAACLTGIEYWKVSPFASSSRSPILPTGVPAGALKIIFTVAWVKEGRAVVLLNASST